MSEDSIIDDYDLRNITVPPEKLLLDPNNPRIMLKIDNSIDYTSQELASEEVQKYILSVVDKAEFHVAELIESIRHSGFLDIGSRMIVERIDSTSKYLVIEGNRRLTAIKHLLSNPADLSPRVLASIKSISANELVFTDNRQHTRKEVIFRLLGMIHLKGQLVWGAMENALYVSQAYKYELEKQLWWFGESIYEVGCARACAETLEMTLREVREELAICSVYSQLHDQGYAVKEDNYTLIDLAVHTPGINNEYFEFDLDILKLSNEGLERFNKLCLEEERPVRNPSDFKKVARIFKNGNKREMGLIETGEFSLDEIVEVVEKRQARHQFLHELEKIERKISSLRFIEPVGLNKEIELATKIRDMANRILRTLN